MSGSRVWSGNFTALNQRNYDTARFYEPTNQLFSAKMIFAKAATRPANQRANQRANRRVTRRVTWLLPIALDAGYRAQLYQAAPLFSLGIGAAFALPEHTMVSIRAENLLRLGGGVSEQACYDGFRRQFHCGTGLAWTDYTRHGETRRDAIALPAIKIKFIKRFSF